MAKLFQSLSSHCCWNFSHDSCCVLWNTSQRQNLTGVKCSIQWLGTTVWCGWEWNGLTSIIVVFRISIWFQIRHLRPVPKPNMFLERKRLVLRLIHNYTHFSVNCAREIIEYFLLQICLLLRMPHRRQICLACQWQLQGMYLILQSVDCLFVFAVFGLQVVLCHS